MKPVLVLALAAVAACQGDSTTPFPAGLSQIGSDEVPPLTGPPTETLQTLSNDTGYIHVYGRGDVLAAPDAVWAGAKNPAVLAAVCTTTSNTVTLDNEPQYEYSFLLHYTVDDFVTVTWDDQWRLQTIDGTPDAPTLAAMKHQKVDGSTFITLSEGTIQVVATDDPDVTELDFVEFLNSVGASTSDVLEGVNHTYASIVAAAHGQPVPPCP